VLGLLRKRRAAQRAEGGLVQTPNEAVETPNESVEVPNEAVATSNESVQTPNEAVETPNEAVETPNEAVETPNEAVATSNEAVATDDPMADAEEVGCVPCGEPAATDVPKNLCPATSGSVREVDQRDRAIQEEFEAVMTRSLISLDSLVKFPT
jgi:CCR4-NOT transcriptional regulation complex NOT5 subunit